MNKKEFTSFFTGEDRDQVSKIYEKLLLAEKSGLCVYSNEFYPPNIWSKLYSLVSKFNLNIETYGGFLESERRITAFYTYELADYPIRLIKVTNKSKFSELMHKDYLGAIMSLGIKREKLGDLVVRENSCYVAVSEDIYEYIRESLEHIGKSPCSIEEVIDKSDIPEPNLKNEVIVSTSYRLDCIASALTGQSRTKCLSMISSGKVLVNYVVISEKDVLVPEKSIVTIRGFGKFLVDECIGSSGSGRLKISVRKYV